MSRADVLLDEFRAKHEHEQATCPFCFDPLEMLLLNLSTAAKRPNRMLLVVDRGNGWDVVQYGPESCGGHISGPSNPSCITLAAAIERVEEMLVSLRRQNDNPERGEMVSDPAEIERLWDESMKTISSISAYEASKMCEAAEDQDKN